MEDFKPRKMSVFSVSKVTEMLLNEGKIQQKRRTSLQKRGIWIIKSFILIFILVLLYTSRHRFLKPEEDMVFRASWMALGMSLQVIEARVHCLWKLETSAHSVLRMCFLGA